MSPRELKTTKFKPHIGSNLDPKSKFICPWKRLSDRMMIVRMK